MRKVSEQNMTEGNPGRLLLWFTIPILLGNIFQQFYNLVDAFIVGRYVSANALAAVGICASVTSVISFLLSGYCIGSSVIIAQYRGAKNDDMIRNALAMSAYILSAWLILVFFLALFLSRWILVMMKTPPEILDDALIYCRLTLCCSFAPTIYYFMSNTLRALGNSRIPLYALVFSSVLNIGLDLLFVIAFHWGVFGVGLATVMAQTISGLCCLIYLYINHRELIPGKDNFHLQSGLIRDIFKIALPTAMQMMCEGLGMMAVQREINGFGADVTIAYTAANKIDMIAMQPMMATGTSVSTYAGQNYGAKDMKRIKSGIWYAVAISAGICLVVTLVIRFAGQSLAGLFISDSEAAAILPISGEYLNVVSMFYFIGSLMYIFTGALRGMGYSFTSMVTSILQMAAKLGAVMVLPRIFGYHGIWYAWPIAWACALFFSVIYFYRVKEIRGVTANESPSDH